MKTSVNKLLVFFVVILLLVNGVLAYFLWKDKKQPPKKKDNNRGDWMANELKLDEKQKEEAKKLKDAHFAETKPLFDSVTAYRYRLYNLIKEPTVSDTLVNYYTKMIGDKHAEISARTFTHFRKMRLMCNPEQQLKLDTLVQKIVKNMNMGGRRRK